MLLGASNVQMGRGGLIAEALGAVGAGAHVFVAAGHGRSYGEWSRVLLRGLPGIVSCGLWPALDERRAPGPGFALLSDIGNDLAYGATPETLAARPVAMCPTKFTGPSCPVGGTTRQR